MMSYVNYISKNVLIFKNANHRNKMTKKPQSKKNNSSGLKNLVIQSLIPSRKKSSKSILNS